MRLSFYFIFMFLSALYAGEAMAQLEPQFSQYMYNKQLFNPAYAGSADAIEANALYRTQYVGVATRATQTEYLGFNMPLYKISSGIGIDVTNDNIGYLRTTTVDIDYDYRKKFSFGSLAIGVNVGFTQTALQGAMLRTPDGVYIGGSINQNDPDVPASTVNGIAPDFGAGIYLNNDRYFVGVAVDHIYSIVNLKNSQVDYARNLILTAGYDIQAGKHFSIMPSVLVKTDLAEVQTDLSLTMKIYNNILTGVAFRGYDARSLDAVILYAGVQIKAFRIVYSYDINTSYLSGFNSGSHEISLAYDLRLLKKTKTGYFYHNSRFL
jgi:type IX secretion system PorP/SprF family membrane protein